MVSLLVDNNHHGMLHLLFSAMIDGLCGTSFKLGFDAVFSLDAWLPIAHDPVFASAVGAHCFLKLLMFI